VSEIGPGSTTADGVVVHALAWLAVGNVVGLLLATLLLAPALGDLLGPVGYGRWMALHLDTQLYGWLGVPLVGLLLRLFVRQGDRRRWSTAVLGIWSGTLLFGCLSWLAGSNSGKPFLEWSGAAAVVLALGLSAVTLLLLGAYGRESVEERRSGRRFSAPLLLKGALLLVLLPVPLVMSRVSQPGVYPPINPDSGGATGGSLLGSSLLVVGIFLVTPPVLRLERRTSRCSARTLFMVLLAHGCWFALLDHGDHSHHEPLQIVSLASLVIWLPLLARYLAGYKWSPAARRWLLSLAIWGGLLLATGLLGFLPGVLEAGKFTNALVAHAHIAMAGMASSFSMIVLLGLDSERRYHGLLGSGPRFFLWQLGLALHVSALVALGAFEAVDPGVLFRAEPASRVLYQVRWGAGLMMLWASLGWLAAAARVSLHVRVPGPSAVHTEAS
jgi:cytochrome c oxidase cbb3-type subunit 1